LNEINDELRKLGPLIDLETARVKNRGRLDRGESNARLAFRDMSAAGLSLSGLCCACAGRWCSFGA
jgi:hypothetical protein